MIVSQWIRKPLTVGLCFLLIQFTLSSESAPALMYQGQATAMSASSSNSYAGQGTPMTTAELDGLAAPIALYPDALVAQILAAATFPDQIAVASYWLTQNKTLTGNALLQAVDKQSWDPSVKALTQFPSVLTNMADNLSWTSSLGEAYHNQQSEMMAAIQSLRAKAKAAGNLKSTPQIVVDQQTPQTIVIQPANPQIVYVPQYNPTVVYGVPVQTPGYTTSDLVATGMLTFGLGIAVGAMMSSGGCCGWGYSSWNCNWHGGAVVYHGGAYYGNSAWHGGYYNSGYHSYGYNNGYNNSGYHSQNYSGNRATNVSGNTVNMNSGQDRQASGADRTASSNGWSSANARGWGGGGAGGNSTAFSGWGSRSGSSGFGGGSWGSRSSSSRGWGSRGGGGGWGGGGFGGGRR